MKPIESLGIADLKETPIWAFTKGGVTTVRPVRKLPVRSLSGRVVATQVRLANGTSLWALLGNVEPGTPRVTEHFLTLSVLKNTEWFTLARYHDFDHEERGPDALARFLGLPVDEVFPITYDIRDHVIGDPASLSGRIPKEPVEKLTEEELMALAVP